MSRVNLPLFVRFGLFCLLFGSLGFAWARFEWREVVQTVEIQRNGDVVVQDERTLWTDEDFGEAFICIHLEPQQTLTLLEGSSLSGHDASSFQQSCESGARGQEIVVRHPFRISEGRVRFRYKLENTLDYYSDVVQWYWNILERKHPDIRAYRLEVSLPGPMAAPYDAYVHRYDNTELPQVVLSEDRSHLSVRFNRIPDDQGVEIRYLMAPELFEQQGDRPGFEKLLRDETIVAGLSKMKREPWWGTIAALIGGFLGWGIFRDYRRFGKEPDIGPTMKYPFEPPSDLPPAGVSVLAAQRSPDMSRAFHATIMDLARRGYGEFAPKGSKFEMHLNLEKSTQGLESFEAAVLNYLKKAASSATKGAGFLGLNRREQDDFEKGHLEFDELKNYSKNHLQSFMSSWTNSTKKWVENHFGGALTSKESQRVMAKWIGLSLLGAALSGAGIFLTLEPARYFFIGSAVISFLLMFVAIFALPAWRKDLAPEIFGWQGFKRTLTDYTIMKDAPDDFFKLWDRYYCYAAALGVAEKYLKNLQRAAPLRKLDETAMTRQATWMGGHSFSSASFSSFSKSISSMSSALTAASASASSGGSSSGGGGGGGGGSSGGR